VVQVELEDVVVCAGGCVDIDCEEIFKVKRVQALFFSFLKKKSKFFLKQTEFVCVCLT